MDHRLITKAIAPLCALTMLLAGCVSNNNWWDQEGNLRTRNDTYVPGMPLAAPDRSVNPVTQSHGGTYVVKKGQTLFAISRDTNIPIRALIDANNLEPPYYLQSGQRLTLPSARFHVVTKGDTVYSISRTHGDADRHQSHRADLRHQGRTTPAVAVTREHARCRLRK